MGDEVDEDRVRIITQDEMNKRSLVDRSFCIERHKGVDILDSKVKVLDARLWGIVVIAIVQLAGMVAILLR